ncbi:MAG: hypothetical protein AB3N09_07465, partial [Tateyamaria sp.]
IGATVGYAAALGKAVGPQEGLDALYTVDPKVRAAFAPAEATKAYLLSALGKSQEAVAAYGQAISLTVEPPLRRYLETRRDVLQATLT